MQYFIWRNLLKIDNGAVVIGIITGSGGVFSPLYTNYNLNERKLHCIINWAIGNTFGEIEIKLNKFSFQKVYLKMPSTNCW